MNIEEVKIDPIDFDRYEEFCKSYFPKIKKLAGELKRKKIVHVNATPVGGGVSELLRSIVGFEKYLGLDSRWFTLVGDLRFFQITKKMHNMLQGLEGPFTKEEKEYYLQFNEKYGRDLASLDADLLMLHDPQPIASARFVPDVPKVTIVHVDLSAPYKPALDFILPFFSYYNNSVFSLPEYIPLDFPHKENVHIIPPAIDPLTVKNNRLRMSTAKNILLRFGVNTSKPIITQVSRFDHWKDPLGVIEAFYIAKNDIPDLQLLLVGFSQAQDDPEALEIFQKVQKEARGDPDLFLFSDLAVLDRENITNDVFVNAVQTASDVVLQKSLREGFGLTATEAMWKEKPLIAGSVGGLKLQVNHEKNGFLVSSPKEAGRIIVELLGHPELRKKIGKEAKKSVKKNFLITRYLYDYLKIYGSTLLKKGS